MTKLIEVEAQHGQPKKYRPECTDEVHTNTWHGAAYPKRKDAEARAKQHAEDDEALKTRIAEAEADRAKRTPKDVIDAAQGNQVQL